MALDLFYRVHYVRHAWKENADALWNTMLSHSEPGDLFFMENAGLDRKGVVERMADDRLAFQNPERLARYIRFYEEDIARSEKVHNHKKLFTGQLQLYRHAATMPVLYLGYGSNRSNQKEMDHFLHIWQAGQDGLYTSSGLYRNMQKGKHAAGLRALWDEYEALFNLTLIRDESICENAHPDNIERLLRDAGHAALIDLGSLIIDVYMGAEHDLSDISEHSRYQGINIPPADVEFAGETPLDVLLKKMDDGSYVFDVAQEDLWRAAMERLLTDIVSYYIPSSKNVDFHRDFYEDLSAIDQPKKFIGDLFSGREGLDTIARFRQLRAVLNEYGFRMHAQMDDLDEKPSAASIWTPVRHQAEADRYISTTSAASEPVRLDIPLIELISMKKISPWAISDLLLLDAYSQGKLDGVTRAGFHFIFQQEKYGDFTASRLITAEQQLALGVDPRTAYGVGLHTELVNVEMNLNDIARRAYFKKKLELDTLVQEHAPTNLAPERLYELSALAVFPGLHQYLVETGKRLGKDELFNIYMEAGESTCHKDPIIDLTPTLGYFRFSPYKGDDANREARFLVFDKTTRTGLLELSYAVSQMSGDGSATQLLTTLLDYGIVSAGRQFADIYLAHASVGEAQEEVIDDVVAGALFSSYTGLREDGGGGYYEVDSDIERFEEILDTFTPSATVHAYLMELFDNSSAFDYRDQLIAEYGSRFEAS